MKSLVCTTPGQFEYIHQPVPIAAPGFTLLRIRRIGICGTDLHAFEGTQPYFTYPRILGHELAAEIVSTTAAGFESGETVTIIPYFNCGSCIACVSGKPNCCAAIKVFGVHIDGGMQELVLVPDSALLKGNGLSLDALAMVEPLAIGAHGVWRASVQPGELVVVVGAGPIGMGAMEFARLAGGIVVAVDVNSERLSFCKKHLHVAHTLNPVEVNLPEQLQQLSDGSMASVVMDATGNLNAINAAFSLLAHGGRYVLVGLQRDIISVNHPEFHKREATLLSSRNAVKADFEQVMEALQTGAIKPENYITHRVAFDEVVNQFASWLDPASGVIKAQVIFE